MSFTACFYFFGASQTLTDTKFTFVSRDRTLRCDHSLETVEQYFTVELLFFNSTQYVIFDLALSRMIGLKIRNGRPKFLLQITRPLCNGYEVK